ncbi:MAG: hypothetical protein A3F54_00020 [Candidatus Kerfeldbacteria bacterium RIFCSPHIGHO2_12_FULL_48_17]|uniref:Uncharacterized protein n=1 Tax=Candidatus Kerfeldbacteria bacterium RIFCSPHIGHO2_12_FULL_48_17 TaxID=1798542 RepID=A0A1G2B0K0_9BACT|nr:MAG: hypothetical protein A3F54_00020 [Candidatus Kerfeldbacteria bacterium RIFCSPHIGHO2_12_FULL_48_17]
MSWLKDIRKTSSKGQLASLQSAALGMVVLIIIVAIGAQILGNIRGTQSNVSLEYNITDSGLNAFDTFADYFDVIVIILVAVVVIGLLVRSFGRVGS